MTSVDGTKIRQRSSKEVISLNIHNFIFKEEKLIPRPDYRKIEKKRRKFLKEPILNVRIKEVIQCNKCPLKFTSISELETHKKDNHFQEKKNDKQVCDVCGKKLKSELGKQQHMEARHEKEIF